MDSSCIKQTVCIVLNIFQHGKYLVAYVLKQIKYRKYSKTYLKWPLKNIQNKDLKGKWYLKKDLLESIEECSREHSAKLLTCIK